MNRRQALSTMAAGVAGLLCPSWAIQPAKRRTINLSEFCCPFTSTRYAMSVPFKQDDWTYATDGRIAVRVAPISGDKKEGGELRLPPASRLAWQHDQLRGWQPLPKVEVEFEDAECDADMCDGGREMGFCDCMEADLPARRHCRKCVRGILAIGLCKTCNGTGKVPFAKPLRIPGFKVCGEYYQKVATLGPVEYTTVDQVDTRCQHGSAIAFRFSEGVGLWMPMRTIAEH